jgi:hypothetical protein
MGGGAFGIVLEGRGGGFGLVACEVVGRRW